VDKEEKLLFTAIKNEQELTSKQVDQLIQFLISEHEDSGKELQQLRKITENYTLPANACNSYTSLFSQIESFESDLLQHIHLENNILFPKLLASYGVQVN